MRTRFSKVVKLLGIAAVAAFFVFRAAAANASIVYADYVYSDSGNYTFRMTCESPNIQDCSASNPGIPFDVFAEVIIQNDVVTSSTFVNCDVCGGRGGITVDSRGNVVGWDFSVFASGGCCFRAFGDFSDSGNIVEENLTLDGATPFVEYAWTGPPGTWSAVALTVTPLPAALPLFASGLGVMGWLGRRRKRKAAAADGAKPL